MKRLLSWLLYRVLKWKVDFSVPPRRKAILCVAPHTSNLDFFYAIIYDRSYGGRAKFLMKKFWFFWPLGILFRHWGGIAVDRSMKTSLTDHLSQQIKNADDFMLAITPEGTRSKNANWKLGFYYIALKAEVPIRLYVLDYKHKLIRCNQEYHPTGDVEKDISFIKNYYRQFKDVARYPSRFEV